MVTAELKVGSSVETYVKASNILGMGEAVHRQTAGVYIASKYSEEFGGWKTPSLTAEANSSSAGNIKIKGIKFDPFPKQVRGVNLPSPFTVAEITPGGRVNFTDIKYEINIPEVGMFSIDFKVGYFLEISFPVTFKGNNLLSFLRSFKTEGTLVDTAKIPKDSGTNRNNSTTKAIAKNVLTGFSIFTKVKYLPAEELKLPIKEISTGIDLQKTQKGFNVKPSYNIVPAIPWEKIFPPQIFFDEKPWIYHFNIHYRTISLASNPTSLIAPPQVFKKRGMIDLNDCNVKIGENENEIGNFSIYKFIGGLPYGSGELAVIIKKHWGELWSYCPPGDPDVNLWFSHSWDVVGRIYRDSSSREILAERWFTTESDVPYLRIENNRRYLWRGRVGRSNYYNLPCLMKVFEYSKESAGSILNTIQDFVNKYIAYRQKPDFYFPGNYYDPDYNPLKQWKCGFGVRATIWNTHTNNWIMDAPDPSNSLWHHGKAMTFMEIVEVVIAPFSKDANEPDPNKIVKIIPPNDFPSGFHVTDTRRPIVEINDGGGGFTDGSDKDNDMNDCPCKEQLEEILFLVRQIHTTVGARQRGHILEYRPQKDKNPDLVFAFNTIPEILLYVLENHYSNNLGDDSSLNTAEKIDEIYEVLGCNKDRVLMQAPAVISNELDGFVKAEDLEKTVDLKTYPEIVFYLIDQITNILGIPGAEIEIPGKIQKATGEEVTELVSKLVIPDIFTGIVVLIKSVLNLQDDESELKNFLIRNCIESHLARLAAIDAAYRIDAALDYMGAEIEEKEMEIPCTFTLPPENKKVKEIDTEQEIQEFLQETKRKIKITKAKNQGLKKMLIQLGEAAAITKAAMSIPIKRGDFVSVAAQIKNLIMGSYRNMTNNEQADGKRKLTPEILSLIKQLEEAYDIKISIDLEPEEDKSAVGN